MKVSDYYKQLRNYLSKRKLVRQIKNNTINKAFLNGSDLSYMNLSNVDLSGAKLKKANLKFARCKNTNFQGADLTGAHLSGANLHEANLTYANLSNATVINANISNSCLYKALFIEADLTNSNLSSIYVDEVTNFTKATMNNIRISERKLSIAITTDAIINVKLSIFQKFNMFVGLSKKHNLRKITPINV
jgi:uncharacterized protein YjbI with pentapeptide repeats